MVLTFREAFQEQRSLNQTANNEETFKNVAFVILCWFLKVLTNNVNNLLVLLNFPIYINCEISKKKCCCNETTRILRSLFYLIIILL